MRPDHGWQSQRTLRARARGCRERADTMSYHGLRVADSDMHVMEPPDLWQRYIDPRYSHAAPIGLDEIPRDMRLRIKNRTVLRLGVVRPRDVQKPGDVWKPEHAKTFARAEAMGWNAESQLEAMDTEHLDVTVLFPSRGLFVLGLDSVSVLGHRRSRARVRDGDRACVQRLAARLLRDRARTDVRCGDGRAARRRRRGRRAATLCRGVRLQGDRSSRRVM